MSSELALANIRAKQVEATMLPRAFELDELPTPALVVNKPALEANIAKMARTPSRSR